MANSKNGATNGHTNGHTNGKASGGSKVTVVLGGQWGDEGKGKLVDILAQDIDIVARCAGGNNAGHTVVVDDVSYDFHMLPSGMVNPKCVSVLGNGVVIHLGQMLEEIRKNEKKGLTEWKNRLLISNRAHLVFDFHQTVDGMQEASKGANQIGTTKKGIGPTYSTKALRNGIRVGELKNFDNFARRYRSLAADFLRQFPNLEINVEEDLKIFQKISNEITPCITDTVVYLNQAIKENRKILVEGANATMLDIDHGTFPFVTSSNCTIGGVCTGLGIPANAIGKAYAVSKAYCTRVGDGPFPTELKDKTGAYLQEKGREVGVTTGRKRRCGWLDCVLLRYAQMINGFTAMALTKLDVLDELDEIQIATEYWLDGEQIEGVPANTDEFERVKVVYETYPGWKTDISKCRTFGSLPIQAQQYVLAVEKHCQIPIGWIGVGPARDAMIPMEM